MPVFHPHVDRPGIQPHLDAIAGEGVGQDLRRVAFFLGQEKRPVLNDGGPRPKAAERLRQFAAQRAATDDQQAARQFGQLEDVLVGQKASLDEAGNRGCVGPRAGGDHRLPEAQPQTIHRHHIGRGEAGMAKEHIDPGRGQPLHRIGAADAGTNAAHAFHHGGKVDTDIGRDLRAVVFGIAHFGVEARRADDRFRRHAADIQTVAAKPGALDQRNLGPQCRRSVRRHQPRRATADHHQSVAVGRRGIAPSVWMHVCPPLALIRVLRGGRVEVVVLRHHRAPWLKGAAKASRRGIPRAASR